MFHCSFAKQLLECADDGRMIQDLPGHEEAKPTMVHTHVWTMEDGTGR